MVSVVLLNKKLLSWVCLRRFLSGNHARVNNDGEDDDDDQSQQQHRTHNSPLSPLNEMYLQNELACSLAKHRKT